MKTIVTMGRGGTGKTCFVAMAAKYLTGRGSTPILLIDLDPDQNLAEMVGADLAGKGTKSISEILGDTFIGRGGTTFGIAPTDRVLGRIWEEGLYEGEDYDLLAIGTKWVEGCYCLPDAALKNALSSLTRGYKNVLIDSPAGLEHLNRRVTSGVDDIFDLIGPSKKSFDHVIRALRIVREVGIEFGRFSLIGGFLFPDDLSGAAERATGLRYLGKVAKDPAVEERVINGASLLDLSPDSPAFRSVAAIMQKAGY